MSVECSVPGIRMGFAGDDDKVFLVHYIADRETPSSTYIVRNPRELLDQLEDLVWRSGKGFCPECGQRIRNKLTAARGQAPKESSHDPH